MLFLLFVRFPGPISPINARTGPAMIFVLESFIFLNYSDKRFWRVASVVFPIITLIESVGLLIVKIV